MMAGGEKSYYEVLGLKPDCTSSDLRSAYKKLAMRWHPDKWSASASASGNAKVAEESKKKFQAIQEAYLVLSDDNKRGLYDSGVYEDDDDDGMSDFVGEMMIMMNETKAQASESESFEELQDLFMDMFEADLNNFSRKRNCSEFQTGSLRKQDIGEPSFCVGSQDPHPKRDVKRRNGRK